ncbi:hypothetical protein SAMN04515671_1812 [Nakamurella panacisegetis]|uniref:DUF5666 domain-containing protein n=1 Tax=Nakamurella panacisegetis TaxID=1090615 RepID=A0A1H0LUJ5_9ACTN|nr:hypothetical protein [Nakamurella panacisegetis]SDO71899.1 hypothetical protein SAMN04515671_1812 [Nakamurella panacisegetis]
MWKKFVVIGGIAAAVGLGIGGVALAATPGSSATGTGAAAEVAPAAATTSASTAAARGDGKHRVALARRLERVAHAQWVTKDGKTGKFVTHDAIRGVVTAVSGTSVTIKAADGTSEAFVINAATTVRVTGHAKGSPATIGEVKVGDRAGVVGTGSAPMTATKVIDRGVAKATTTSVPPTS